jgi:hypothetical protein
MDALEPEEKLAGKTVEFSIGQINEFGRKIAYKINERAR